MSSLKENTFTIVNRIPKGKVAYYGQIATVLRLEFEQMVTAQIVGWTLSGMKVDEYGLCQWQRVVAKNGFISALKLGAKGMLQKELLISEGHLLEDDTVNMSENCVLLEEILGR